MKIFYKSFLTMAFMLFAMVANAQISVSDLSLTVAEGEQIDEDGDFKVTLNYKVNGIEDGMMLGGSVKVSVYDADNTCLVEKEPWTFSPTSSFKNIYVSNLEGGKNYTIKVDEIVIKDNSKIDWETVFEGEEILKLTEDLPTLTFTPIAAKVEPIEIKGMSMSYNKNELIDGDGDYMVTFNYTGKINDPNINPLAVYSFIKYQVYDTDYNYIGSGTRDFDITESSRNVYVSGLQPGKEYIFMVTGVVVICEETEVINLSNGLPKLTFKVKDPNAPQPISMSDMSFTIADGEQIDSDGDFKVTFNYTTTVNDASAVNFPYPIFTYEVKDENGTKVAGTLVDFSCDANSKNFYISNLEDGKTYTITATKIEIQDFMSMDMLYEMSANLPTLTFTVGSSTGINNATVAAAKAGKFVENGKLVIVKGGKKYGVNAVEVK